MLGKDRESRYQRNDEKEPEFYSGEFSYSLQDRLMEMRLGAPKVASRDAGSTPYKCHPRQVNLTPSNHCPSPAQQTAPSPAQQTAPSPALRAKQTALSTDLGLQTPSNPYRGQDVPPVPPRGHSSKQTVQALLNIGVGTPESRRRERRSEGSIIKPSPLGRSQSTRSDDTGRTPQKPRPCKIGGLYRSSDAVNCLRTPITRSSGKQYHSFSDVTVTSDHDVNLLKEELVDRLLKEKEQLLELRRKKEIQREKLNEYRKSKAAERNTFDDLGTPEPRPRLHELDRRNYVVQETPTKSDDSSPESPCFSPHYTTNVAGRVLFTPKSTITHPRTKASATATVNANTGYNAESTPECSSSNGPRVTCEFTPNRSVSDASDAPRVFRKLSESSFPTSSQFDKYCAPRQGNTPLNTPTYKVGKSHFYWPSGPPSNGHDLQEPTSREPRSASQFLERAVDCPQEVPVDCPLATCSPDERAIDCPASRPSKLPGRARCDVVRTVVPGAEWGPSSRVGQAGGVPFRRRSSKGKNSDRCNTQ